MDGAAGGVPFIVDADDLPALGLADRPASLFLVAQRGFVLSSLAGSADATIDGSAGH